MLRQNLAILEGGICRETGTIKSVQQTVAVPNYAELVRHSVSANYSLSSLVGMPLKFSSVMPLLEKPTITQRR